MASEMTHPMSPFTKFFAFISCCCSHNYRTSTGNSTDFPCFVNGYSPIIFTKDPFPAPTVKFAIQDLFPWAKIQLPLGYGDDDVSTHHLPFEMRTGVILARAIVVVLGRGSMGGQLFEPNFVIMQE